jgi:phosphatidylglycerophosphatase A
MRLRDRAILFISSGGFVGKISFAPGTFGSVLGLPVCYCLAFVKVRIAILLTLLFVVFSIWIADRAEKLLRSKDPGYIVIDEIAGLLVTFLGIPFNLLNGAAGFLIFRIMDILKPFPARMLEKQLPGGAGVVMDDVAAGLYSNLLLRALVVFIIPWN